VYLYLYLCLCLCLYQYQLVPYLIYRFLIYLPTYCMQEPPQQGIIHSFIHPLPPFLPPGCRLGICLYLYLCVRASVYVRVYPCICPCACTYIHTIPLHTHKKYISKVQIKDTYQRYMYTCILGYVVVFLSF